MSFINLKSHQKVWIDSTQPLKNRMWALRSCCYSLASLQQRIDTDEIIKIMAEAIEAKVIQLNNKNLIQTKLEDAHDYFVRVRSKLLETQKSYIKQRKTLKEQRKRFPVQRCFSKEEVENVFKQERKRR